MSPGLSYRLGRIFGQDGRTMILPIDHGLIGGRVHGLENPRALLDVAIGLGCDGFLMSQGMAQQTAQMFGHRDAPVRVLTVDSLYGARDQDPGSAALVASVETAVRLGLDAVKLLMPWDVPSAQQAATAERIAGVVKLATAWEMPVMVEPIAMRLPQGPEAVEVECHASRIAMELGADIIKVGYPGNVTIMKSLCDELGVPVVILGGPGTGTVTGLLRMVGDALAGGASGIVIGRKVWQQDQRIWTSLAKALVRMVHGGLTTDEAIDVLEAAG